MGGLIINLKYGVPIMQADCIDLFNVERRLLKHKNTSIIFYMIKYYYVVLVTHRMSCASIIKLYTTSRAQNQRRLCSWPAFCAKHLRRYTTPTPKTVQQTTRANK